MEVDNLDEQKMSDIDYHYDPPPRTAYYEIFMPERMNTSRTFEEATKLVTDQIMTHKKTHLITDDDDDNDDDIYFRPSGTGKTCGPWKPAEGYWDVPSYGITYLTDNYRRKHFKVLSRRPFHGHPSPPFGMGAL